MEAEGRLRTCDNNNVWALGLTAERSRSWSYNTQRRSWRLHTQETPSASAAHSPPPPAPLFGDQQQRSTEPCIGFPASQRYLFDEKGRELWSSKWHSLLHRHPHMHTLAHHQGIHHPIMARDVYGSIGGKKHKSTEFSFLGRFSPNSHGNEM